jgi:hypothetical protein
MRILVKKSIKILLFAQLLVIISSSISYSFFLNAQVAFLSSFIILLGSMYSYKKLVMHRIENEMFVDDERDELDKIDDKHELFDELVVEEHSVLEIKNALNEEKKQLKSNNFKNVKASSGATVSLFRIVPYLFLVVGFIGLQNNHLLQLLPYLLFLSLGLAVGYFVGKEIFSSKQLLEEY